MKLPTASTYAIGDVQGCYGSLRRLVDRVEFDPARDVLWFVGDLVNRGPSSARVLRWVRRLGDRAVTVLGNHDLHLLAAAWGVRPTKRRDTFQDVLAAEDGHELLTWLRHRPVLHRDNGRLLVHAGLHPAWKAGKAERIAGEIESVLQGPEGPDLLRLYYSVDPKRQVAGTGDLEALAAALVILTHVRMLDDDLVPDLEYSGRPDEGPKRLTPWFAVPGRRTAHKTVVFGHWSMLGLMNEPGLIALDTGCVWGGSLTAMRLEDREVISERAPQGVEDETGR